jgi:hypothetical protein
VLQEIGVDILGDQALGDVSGVFGDIGHQKYPSCFFFSIEAA